MTFEEVLDQVIAMIQRRGRVTYRALKLQFDLDDDTVETLKEELFFAHPQVRDEAETGLVWVDSIHQSEPDHSPEAERRQLTVMFCDLADSTRLSSQLDPEDYRHVIRNYQEVAQQVIERFDGYIAQYLGDGLLIYFGWPHAHEDDASRTIRAGLALLQALDALNLRLEQDTGVTIALRIGIHTGLVVVGSMGGAHRDEQLAMGETPNIAARLQGRAAHNSVVISEATRLLVGSMFILDALGPQTFKGVERPISTYRVCSESDIHSRFEAATTAGMTSLIGRDEELGVLLDLWAQAEEGRGRVVQLRGEAGIGKSRLVQALCEQLNERSYTRLFYQCLPYYSASAWFPVTTQLERAARFAPDDLPSQKLEKLEALLGEATEELDEVTPLVAALLGIPTQDRYPAMRLSSQQQKARTIEALVNQLVGLSRKQPVLCLFEDAHWNDPTSLELLTEVVNRVSDERILVVSTYRPEFTPPWTQNAQITTLSLSRLSAAHVATIIGELTGGKSFPEELYRQIFEKTDGVPLFVEELTKTVLESELLHEGDRQYEIVGPLPPLAIPTTLQDSLMARLDRLAPVKEVAQLGSAIGRTFSYDLLSAVSLRDEAQLQVALAQLVEAEVLVPRGHSGLPLHYSFRHALVQEAAYASLLKSARQQLHSRIALAFESHFPEMVTMRPELVARHYTEAGLTDRAISYWQQAGEKATQTSAYLEAISHLRQGLELLITMPHTRDRDERELHLQVALFVPLLATRGYTVPEVEEVYTRARELCQQVGETQILLPVLHATRGSYIMRAEHHTVRDLAGEILRLAQDSGEPALIQIGHTLVGESAFWMGNLPTAREHLEQAIALYTPSQHQAHSSYLWLDMGVAALCYMGQVLWNLGYPTQALARSQDALALSEELNHPFSMAFSRCFLAWVNRHIRAWGACQEHGEAAIAISKKHGLATWLPFGILLRGIALVSQGSLEEGHQQIDEGLKEFRATGVALGVSNFLGWLAQAQSESGQLESALGLLAEAITSAQEHAESIHESELHRLKGELKSLQAVTIDETENCLVEALSVARRQEAKSLELRAAMSLCRLWSQQGNKKKACDLLAPVYEWFTEGFDTGDLIEAKHQLDTLSR